MQKVVIVGGSPAAYMCSIYVHTANIPPLVVKTHSRSNFDFSGADKVAGVAAQSAEEFTGLVEQQARNMGIAVVEESVQDMFRDGDVFTVVTDAGSHQAESLVVDDWELESRFRSVLGEQDVFYTSDRISHREAIVVASAGCKTSFDIKECIENK